MQSDILNTNHHTKIQLPMLNEEPQLNYNKPSFNTT